MTLTFHTEYAFRIIIYLLLHPDKVVPTRLIAEKYGISVNHLNKVSQRLVALGVTTSTRGKGGGIKLAPTALNLKLGELMCSIEPPTEPAQCSGVGQHGACVISPVCGLRGILAGAQDAFWQHLNQYTLEDLIAKNEQQMRELLS